MSQAKGSWITMAVLAGVLVSASAFSSGAAAQTAPAPAENTASTADNAVMLTVFVVVVLVTTAVSLGRYCLTSDGADTRALPRRPAAKSAPATPPR